MKEEKMVPEIRFPEFDEKWETKKLGDVSIKIGSGKTPLGGESVYVSDGIPFIRSQNVINDSLVLDSTCIPESVHEEMKSSKVLPKDILLNITGGSIGRSCVVPDNFNEGNVNQHVCIIRLKNNDSNFAQSLLSSWRGQKLVFQGQTGSGREGLNFESIKSFKFHFPSLPEQQKIATFLTAVDKRINLLTQKKEKLEEYKKGVMQKLFPSIKSKGRPNLRFLEFNAPLKKDTFKGIANEKLANGVFNDPKKNGTGYFLINVKDMYSNLIIKKTELSRLELEENEFKKNKVKYGDIFFTRSSLVREGIAHSTVNLSKDNDITYDGHLIKLSPNLEIINPIYLGYLTKTNFVRRQLINKGKTGTMTTIGQDDISSVKIFYPSLPEQQKIASFLSALDKQIEQVAGQVEKMKEWKKGLLQKMFV